MTDPPSLFRAAVAERQRAHVHPPNCCCILGDGAMTAGAWRLKHRLVPMRGAVAFWVPFDPTGSAAAIHHPNRLRIARREGHLVFCRCQVRDIRSSDRFGYEVGDEWLSDLHRKRRAPKTYVPREPTDKNPDKRTGRRFRPS